VLVVAAELTREQIGRVEEHRPSRVAGRRRLQEIQDQAVGLIEIRILQVPDQRSHLARVVLAVGEAGEQRDGAGNGEKSHATCPPVHAPPPGGSTSTADAYRSGRA